MFVRYYVTINRPISECRDALLKDPDRWLPNVVTAAHEPSAAILAKVGFSMLAIDLRKQVAISVGEPLVLRDWLHLPISWEASPRADLFPTFQGEIQLVPIDAAITKLAVAGTYEPPLGDMGRALDNLAFHTAAEATIKDFVEGVAVHMRPLHSSNGRHPAEPSRQTA